jgi:CelD/BcsL family acetyltransferase involved in cellulose biosynthesis
VGIQTWRNQKAVAAVAEFARWPTPGVFVSGPWVQAAWRHLPELGGPLAITSTGPAGDWLLPLSMLRSEGKEVVALAGAPLGDAHDLVRSPPSASDSGAAPLVDHLARFDAVSLEALDPDGVLARMVMRRNASRWRCMREPAPIIPVTTPRAGALRRWRRLARRGRLELHVLDGEQLVPARAREFVRRRRSRWIAQGRADELPSVEWLPGFPAFMEEAVPGLSRLGLARLWMLLLDGRPIAEDLHLGPRVAPLLYMRNYDLAHSQWSPGRVLLEATLGYLAEQRVAALATGRGDEPYKLELGGGPQHVVNAFLDRVP